MPALEDGHEIARKAVLQLLAAQHNPRGLAIRPLPEFLHKALRNPLTRADRELICDQAVLVIEQFYAHLPFKRSRYAIDPVQRLRLLRAGLDQLEDDRAFHAELIETFADMRDCHTSYRLPPPHAGAIAFLPFFLQAYFDDKGERRFLVTHVLPGFVHPYFQPGVEIIQWNGMPVSQAVKRLAEHIPGGNPAARFMRGLMRMTVRSLASTLPPDEHVVFVRYRPAQGNKAERILELPWYAGKGMGLNLFQARGVSVCEPLKDLSIVRRLLWCREELRAPRLPKTQVSKLPGIFQFQHSGGVHDPARGSPDPMLLQRGAKRFGYIRIRTFEGDDGAIFGEFQRLLLLLRTAGPDGLILDVRGNAGGSINAAERLLQLLTPRPVTPAPFQFANTPALQAVIARLRELAQDRLKHPELLHQVDRAVPFFEDWFTDTPDSMLNGNLLTRGRPLTSPDSANDTGQIYYGPVALLIDAASYSATDTFAAGFQDHAIGPIIGVDENTGGGGASRWLHNQELVERLQGIVDLQPPLQLLPGGVSMALALQRSARIGLNAGDAVEDAGVKCDILRRLTRIDLLQSSRDLIGFTCGVLAKRTAYRLEIKAPVPAGDEMSVTVQSRGIGALSYLLDGYPQGSLHLAPGSQDAETAIRIPRSGFGGGIARTLQVNAYACEKNRTLTLVAAARAALPSP